MAHALDRFCFTFVRSKPIQYLAAKYGTDEPMPPDDPDLENPDVNSESICQSNSYVRTPVGKL